jgi:hypothetical protein
MLALEFFGWWYGAGWRLLARNMQKRMRGLARMFSVSILVRTIFAPWKRIITYPGKGLDAQMHAMADNMVSRLVGFTIRVFVLIAAGITLLLGGILSMVELVAWPLLPIAAIVLLVKGIMG